MNRPNYSDNWHHLKTLLNGFSLQTHMEERNSLQDHIYAKAISIFLANATLATQKLDRVNVEAILTGDMNWPNDSGKTNHLRGNLPLSFLEENGFVSFYADWLSVHYNSFRDRSDIHSSLYGLLDALDLLKDIKYGWNGFTRPYFKCTEQTLKKCLRNEFGHDDLTKLLPNLTHHNNYYELTPGNQSFDSLVSKYLWQTLKTSMSAEEAFNTWMLSLRVNCDWCFPIKFTDFELEEQKEFNDALLDFLVAETELNNDLTRIGRQAVNDSGFSILINQESLKVDIENDIVNFRNQGISAVFDSEEEVALNTLSNQYLPAIIDSNANNFEFVKSWKQSWIRGRHEIFYASLINNAIKSNVRIEEQSLISHDFIEKILELAKSRPVLRHLLFNELTEFRNYEFKILLLSRPDTSDIGMFYLTQESFSKAFRPNSTYTQPIDNSFQLLVSDAYLRSIENEPDCAQRLFKIIEHMGEQCDFTNVSFANGYEYKFLNCMLNRLSNTKVKLLADAFVDAHSQLETPGNNATHKLHIYSIGFWLAERLEHFGVNASSMKTTLLNYYLEEFKLGLDGSISLYPNELISILPWHKVISEETYTQLLRTSNNLSTLRNKLDYSKNKQSYISVSALKRHLLVLMSVGRAHSSSIVKTRITQRIFEIVKALGFGPSEDAIFIFNESFNCNKMDIWPQFCSYTNLFEETQFEEFIECCLDLIPPNQRFKLFERCTKINRTKVLEENIASLRGGNYEEMGIKGIEEAFISATKSNQDQVATDLLNAAKEFLNQERFTGNANSHFVELKNTWLNYDYKWRLITLLKKHEDDLDKFRTSANNEPIPEYTDTHSQLGNKFKADCDRFRRYIIASALVQSEVDKSILMLEQLCKEVKTDDFTFMLFNARIKYFNDNSDLIGLRGALSTFLEDITLKPSEMETSWAQISLDTFRKLGDKNGIEVFWNNLSLDQKCTKDILHPYCKARIEWGETLIAQQVIDRYKEMNPDAIKDLGIDDLYVDIGQAHSTDVINGQINILNGSTQLSNSQLSDYFKYILSKPFLEYVEIIRPGSHAHDYLREHVVAIMKDLLLRRKNLRIHSKESLDSDNYRITEEDLINDWFTTLFDARLAHAKIGFRDQKRGGESSSGKRPGETDGFITDAENQRLAIFEAFRLFSLNTNVIDEHLNKISKYDIECLSPVFIAAYCDVSDFNGLVLKYKAYIHTSDYTGFSQPPSGRTELSSEIDNPNFWLGKEIRFRGRQEVVFYHFLLNFGGD